MTYSEKLKDPRWQKKRLEILQRDDWKCRFCGDGSQTLHVHHLEYFGNPWDAPNAFLLTTCDYCHESEHKQRKESEKQLLRGFALMGMSATDIDCIAEGLAQYDCTEHTPIKIARIMRWIFFNREVIDMLAQKHSSDKKWEEW